MTKSNSRNSVAALTLGALGVVYGDIGTSPLYTMKKIFNPATGIPLEATHLIGAVSGIFWGLTMVVMLKYVLLILRTDNRGDGGIMALTALFDVQRFGTGLAAGFWKVQINYGFKSTPEIPKALELCAAHGLAINLVETSYFLSREIVVPTKGKGMAHWREALFGLMSRNSGSVAGFFKMPNNCVIELGTRVQI